MIERKTVMGIPVVTDPAMPTDIIRLVQEHRDGVSIVQLNMSTGTLTKIEESYESIASRQFGSRNPRHKQRGQ